MKAQRNISQKEWNVLAKKHFGNLSTDEEKALKSELEAFDTADLAEIETIAEQLNLYYKLRNYNSEGAFKHVISRVESNRKGFFVSLKTSSLLRVAAVIVLALLVGSVWFLSQDQLKNDELAEQLTEQAGITNIELPDGSLVTLNRNSKIDYPDEFADDKREVFIEGEAFFDVVPNPEKPFIIHAGGAFIKVLGTSFNVNAYPENERVEVTVSSGKVQFYSEDMDANSEKEIILDPGEKGIFVNASKEFLKMNNQDPNFMAWKTRHLIFNETSLKEVMSQLRKLYDVDIRATEPGLNELKYTGHFENHSVEFILEVISLTFDIEVNEEDECYFLKKES